MTIRPIRELGDPVLRTPADPVPPSTAGWPRWSATSRRPSTTPAGPAGRAADRRQRAGVSYNVDGVIGHLVNPVIVERSEETQDGDEGCLSVPGIWAPTVRAMHCVAEGSTSTASRCGSRAAA